MPTTFLRNILGRNGVDDGFTMPDWQASEVVNCEFTKPGKFGIRRRGSALATVDTSGALGFYGFESTSTTENKSFWQIDTDGDALRAGVSVTMTDESMTTTQAYDATAVTFNGKYFLAYKSTVNRLHKYNPATSTVQRVGLAVPGAAPTVADTGAGAYAATIRYYKVAWAEISGTDHLRRSELSASVSFTPSGAGTAARVTRPTAPSEGETHWLLYASPDNVNYFLIATTLIATTTYDDSTNPSAYTGDTPHSVGQHIPPPSCKYLLSDGSRLLMAGAWETSAATGQTVPKNNRVWFTPRQGALDVGDDERVPNIVASATDPGQKNWIDVGENDGSAIVGLGGPLNGVIYVFKRRGIYKLIATGDDVIPYRVIEVTRTLGAVHQRSIQLGEDEQGLPCLYFMDFNGPYRISDRGIQYLGRDVEDLLLTATVPMQRDAASAHVAAVWYPAKKQVWWAAKNTDGYSIVLVFSADVARATDSDEVRGGWWKWEGPSATGIYYSLSLIQQAGENATTLNVTPVLAGTEGGTSVARIVDRASTTQDSTTNYRAYITTKPVALAGLGTNFRVEQPHLHAKAQTGTITVSIIADYGREQRDGTVSIAAGGTETRVQKRVENVEAADLGVVQFQVGDGAAQNVAAWELDALAVPWAGAEAR